MPDVLWVDETGKTTVREVDEDGNLVDEKPAPFGGKGDHDHNGKAGGTAPPVTRRKKR